jgi:hypothetical protein
VAHKTPFRFAINCHSALQREGYVNFGFFFGAVLSDPKKLLVGERKRRQVKIWNADEAKNPPREMDCPNLETSAHSVAKGYTGMKKRKA